MDIGWRTAAAAALAAVALAGCSSSDDQSADSSSTSSTSTTPTSSASAARGLKDTCPLLEALDTPDDLAPPDETRAYVAKVQELADAGDTETKNALEFVIDAYSKQASAEPGPEALAAFDAVTQAIEVMKDRCKAAGSSAFQG